MYNNDAMKVLTGECRLSYVHLNEPRAAQPGAEPKYGVTILIPKSDFATKADIDQSIQAAIAEGVTKTWGGQRPAMPKIPLYDGDGVRPSGEPFGAECRGHWVITGSSKDKPQVVHISNVKTLLSPHDIYSGMYGRVTIRFFTYSNSGNRGVGCGLGNVLKTREGEPLAAGRSDAADDFASLEQTAPPQAINFAAYASQPAYAPVQQQPQYQPVQQPPYAPAAQQPAYNPAAPAGYYAPAQQPPYAPAAQQPAYNPAAPAGYYAPAQQPAYAPAQINPITGQPM